MKLVDILDKYCDSELNRIIIKADEDEEVYDSEFEIPNYLLKREARVKGYKGHSICIICK